MQDYSKLIAVTNRHLSRLPYLEQIERIASLHPNSLILREKDLSQDDYFKLAKDVLSICKYHDVSCYIHSHHEIAKKLACPNIHLSLENFKRLSCSEDFTNISVSCHSLSDVITAEKLGATRIVLGTIFETDCKKGLTGKGLNFVKEICTETKLPVYAIGGITPDKISGILDAGAAGGCMMSYFMKS